MDFSAPIYYVASRLLTCAQLEWVTLALKIHPVSCAIIWDVCDSELARKLSDAIVLVADEQGANTLAEQLAKETGVPSLVIGDVELLTAVYEDGKKEKIS